MTSSSLEFYAPESSFLQDDFSPLLDIDSYKASHFNQRPDGTTDLFAYGGPRRSSNEDHFPEVVVFGLNRFFKKFWNRKITQEEVDEYGELMRDHGLPIDFNLQRTVGEYLPVEVFALPEGTVVPRGVPHYQAHSLVPELSGLAIFLETQMLRGAWYPSTIATRSFTAKRLIKKYLEETHGSLDSLPFKLHDFGSRGVSVYEQAQLGGMAHLTSFQGTDTVPALREVRKYYGRDLGKRYMAGYSIAGMEHSTVTPWGPERELEAYSNMMDKYLSKGTNMAMVTDSYNHKKAIELIGTKFASRIIFSGGTVILRPDSGNPVDVSLETIQMLENYFGFEMTPMGYKVLPNCIRVIYGDGINDYSMIEILENLKKHKYSTDNISFGMGGGLLQATRDLLYWAQKANAICVNNSWHDVSKNPATDPTKKSLAGVQAVVRESDGSYSVIRADSLRDGQENLLVPVWKQGKMTQDPNFEEIRARIASHI